ncbi:hypothetical protein LB503_008075 [Fusarium chuoi]|nr:hypothetical protein LB503_008075 [Fusarium chuoi]
MITRMYPKTKMFHWNDLTSKWLLDSAMAKKDKKDLPKTAQQDKKARQELNTASYNIWTLILQVLCCGLITGGAS